MSEKIVVGPVNRGFRNDRTAFVIDNDSFPQLINAYQWRGRVKRKRGTSLLTRLRRYFDSTSTAYNSGSTTITLDGSGIGNILTDFSLESTGNIIPGTVTITAPGPTLYTDPSMDGTLSPSGTINYATGEITILAEAGNAVSAVFSYYPVLPVMGLEELDLVPTQFEGTLGFDTVYSYNILNTLPYSAYDVSFYKNLANATYTGYLSKSIWTPTTWNGQDYQQFWSANYQGALWATNGINIPFSITNIGMQYKPILTVTVTAGGPPATADIQITGHGLVVGDFVFINEVLTTTGINFQTGYVTVVIDANNVTVEFPNATIAANGTGGIAQYLTNRSDTTVDCIRWYDGDPTDGNISTPGFSTGKGWVNFAPPLSRNSYSISDLPLAQYYLVGARMIVPFKDRLLFLGPVVQTSTAGSQVYLQDTIIYSQNGTPYYTCSFTGDVSLSTTVFHEILVPTNQTASASAYFEDQTGFGGFITLGLSEPIVTCSVNEDVLIAGLNTIQTQIVNTGNDIVPFNIFFINSELGSASTFSAINLDKGVISRGERGFIITSQVETKRFDLDIPDEVFEMKLTENGNERFCAQRDFINEWIYFTYPVNNINFKFPSQTLQYNYRDDSWAIFIENYTTYGSFRKQTGFTWATVGSVYPTWKAWNVPWNAGSSTLLQPEVIAGNQQGFVLVRDDGTEETESLTIQSFSGNTVTSINHGLNNEDFIIISGCLGTVSTQVNNLVFKVFNVTTNTFQLDPVISAGTYFGGGLIKRIYKPFIQTKQFPTAWGMGRKTRLGVQQYLLTRTDNAQIQLLIYLSQDASNPYNNGPIVPSISSLNNSLIYDTTLYTCPESTNLGLTPANTNLQMQTSLSSAGISSNTQAQIWHRVNTSLIGDTVQLAFTLSEDQLRNVDDDGNPISQFAEIELHGFILDVSSSSMLS